VAGERRGQLRRGRAGAVNYMAAELLRLRAGVDFTIVSLPRRRLAQIWRGRLDFNRRQSEPADALVRQGKLPPWRDDGRRSTLLPACRGCRIGRAGLRQRRLER